ncbi:MAG TPA: protein translocase subunit SecD [Aggregatilineales bacterium]|mgnify:FL=1|nr:protein translocase subunit SecD [Chloroflexota bacterium]HOA24821.1 protein translocase subunit SecD [Aggregatilineales bacterium]HQA68449.1 protein translocase subunit SecD [Aggregatilineales bacterium]
MSIFPLIWLGAAVVAGALLAVFRPGRHVTWLVIIAFIVAFAVWTALPNNPGFRLDIDGDGELEIDRDIEVRQGLDLAGGVKVLLEADLPDGQSPPPGAMDEVRRIVESRIDALGALEPIVQLQGESRLIVELPGLDDPESAVELIRETALLEFVEVPGPIPAGMPILTSYAVEQENITSPGEAEAEADGGADTPTIYETVMTGEILRTADVQFDPTTGEPLVTFTLTPEGARQFGEYTSQHIGGWLAIVLDGVVVSAPQINDAITGGEGVIQGQFTLEEATRLATQLRYGALPIPLEVQSTSTIGPTLGEISVEQSIRAGLIGIVVVLLFMLIYYRLPGVAAALALVIFALINFALYKLIPVTMTLPAITGFLISVGTAVDGNILIFERLKEELRRGRTVERAVEAGFDRAWTSIRDSNLSTLIIAGVLYAFGTSFGAGTVRGFAVTLALGLIINLFTAITVTRTFLHFLLIPVKDDVIERQPGLMGL